MKKRSRSGKCLMYISFTSWAPMQRTPTQRTPTQRAPLGPLIALFICSICFTFLPLGNHAFAADPVKVGFSLGLTVANAPNGKQLLIALEIWHDDVNAKGGLLGRPVELVYYDDQTNPSNESSIYTKLTQVDKVDLILGPYGTNQISAALAVIAPLNLTTIGILGTAANGE